MLLLDLISILGIFMKKLSNSQNLTLSNKIVKGKYKLTKEEQNFIYLLISQISKDDVDFNEYKIHISDLEDRQLTKKNYQRYREFADSLFKKPLRIEDDKQIINANWFSSLRYVKNTGYIYAKFDPCLKPYFLELKEEFTQTKLPTLLKFTSKYSSRLFLLLKSEYDRQKSFRKNLFINYDVEDLQQRFEMPKSYIDFYSKFKNMFLIKSINEINEKTDLSISYKELKTGRKITSIQFCISKLKQSLDEVVKNLMETKTKSDYIPQKISNKAVNILVDDELDLSINDLKNIFEHYLIEDIEQICEELWNIWDSKKLISHQAFFRGKLKQLNRKEMEN